MDSNGTHFAVPKPCGVYFSYELKASVPGEAAEPRAAFREL